MWYDVINSEAIRPAEVDTTSSRVYAYIRRNITLVDEVKDGETVIPAHYRWQELRIPREMWEVAEKVLGHDAALDDVYDALAELAEMLVEVTG